MKNENFRRAQLVAMDVIAVFVSGSVAPFLPIHALIEGLSYVCPPGNTHTGSRNISRDIGHNKHSGSCGVAITSAHRSLLKQMAKFQTSKFSKFKFFDEFFFGFF